MQKLNFMKKTFSSKLNQNILYDPTKDYYKLLNVDKNAEFSEIKKSFYKLSIKHHPDKGGKEDDFKNINNAYEVLKSSEDRELYDKLQEEYENDLDFRIKENHINKKNKSKEKYESNYKNRSAEETNKNNNSGNTRNNENYDYNFYAHSQSQSYNRYKENKNTHSSDEYNDYKDYKQNFKSESEFEAEFNRRYREFINKIKEHYQEQNKEKDSFSENMFLKFKHNVRYTPIDEKEIKIKEFKLELTHKHHILNRIKNYNKKKATISKFSLKKNVNPFEITNDMNLDKDFLACLNKNEDDESLDKRLTLKDLHRVYTKTTFFGFLFFNLGIIYYFSFIN